MTDTEAMGTDAANKIALVLSGGGAYGAYEVGVIKALFEGRSPSTPGPLDPDVFVGTSVGSFNAAVLAMNKGGARESLDRLHAIWNERIADDGGGRGNGVYRVRGYPGDYLDPRLPGSPIEQLHRLLADTTSLGRSAMPRLLNFLSPGTRSFDRVKDMVDISMFLDTEPFRQLVEDSLDPHAIRDSLKVLPGDCDTMENGPRPEFRLSRHSGRGNVAGDPGFGGYSGLVSAGSDRGGRLR